MAAGVLSFHCDHVDRHATNEASLPGKKGGSTLCELSSLPGVFSDRKPRGGEKRIDMDGDGTFDVREMANGIDFIKNDVTATVVNGHVNTENHTNSTIAVDC